MEAFYISIMQFVTQIAYLDERPNVRKETAILISLLNCKNRELTPFLLYRRRRHKREVTMVSSRQFANMLKKVASYQNLELWIICLQQLFHNRQLKTADFQITSLSIENRVNFVRAIHHTKSVKLTSFNAIFIILLLTLLSERHLLENALPAPLWSV